MKKSANEEWVTFKFHAAVGSSVYVAGTFNGWDPAATPMSYESNGVYSKTLLLPLGRYEYRFIVNGVWCNDPNHKDLAPNPFGTQNSVVHVTKATDHKARPHTFNSRSAVNKSNLLWTAS